jgi:hypothetical protein
MKLVARNPGLMPLIVLSAVVLRAFIPVGYMPALSAGGLPFELCHDGMPADIMAALQGHADPAHSHGAQHGGGAAEADADGCVVGHILALAFIDSPARAQIEPAPCTVFDPSGPSLLVPRAHRIATSARGPPLV